MQALGELKIVRDQNPDWKKWEDSPCFSRPGYSKIDGSTLASVGMLTDLPNLLTLSRIAAIPLLVALVAINTGAGDFAACIIFGAAAITDYFDGKLARSRRQQSNLGSMLDPIADKLLVGAVLMMLVGQNRLSAPGLYPAIVIMLREILVSGLREYLAGVRVGLPVTQLAKWKTGFQMGALGTLLAGDTTAKILHLGFLPVSFIGETMLWIAAALTLITGWDYLITGLRHAAMPATRAPSVTE
jgi:cardiolipin synthase